MKSALSSAAWANSVIDDRSFMSSGQPKISSADAAVDPGDQPRALPQPRAEQFVGKVGAGLVDRRDRESDRSRAAAQPAQLREYEPHPVASLPGGSQFVDDGVVNAILRVDEPLQVKWIVGRRHVVISSL